MTLLDTDHLTVLVNREHSQHDALVHRMLQYSEPVFAMPIVSAEEQMRGWLAQIRGLPEVRRQVSAYQRLARLLQFLGTQTIALFDDRAAEEFVRLRKQRIRIGTQDLKIAAIALVNDALLLSANQRHFACVPGLRVENWLE